MTTLSENYFSTTDGLRLFYRDDPDHANADSAVLCLHGLTRNSRDFQQLAEHLRPNFRVIAPDMRGRGHSDYDRQWQNYYPGTYVLDMFTLLDTLKIKRVAIVGTSLGALMAMRMTAQQPQRIAGIVLNDAGPEIDPRGLARIAQYAGTTPTIRNWEDVAQYVKSIYGEALWGLSDADWLAYAKLTYRENSEGIPVPDYDTNIGNAFRANSPANTSAPTLWPVFAQIIKTPMLVIRGEHSDILSAATVLRMAKEKPDLNYVAVPDRGHAPLLNEPVCVTAIDRFLNELKF
ncbi:MAG: alpha/beta hydrolase [Spongiibacteraceae bacterium]